MKIKILILGTVFNLLLTGAAVANMSNGALTTKLYSQGVCNAKVTLSSSATNKNQIVKVSEKVSLELSRYLSSINYKGSKIVDNVICQKLSGASYTGSKQEWAAFIQNAAEGIKNAKAIDIQLFLIADKAKVFPSIVDNKEYDFKANFDGNKQIIKNLAVLDKENNTVYTLSVSGAQRVENEVNKEFRRLVNSFKLDK